jgi:hypothetical protein
LDFGVAGDGLLHPLLRSPLLHDLPAARRPSVLASFSERGHAWGLLSFDRARWVGNTVVRPMFLSHTHICCRWMIESYCSISYVWCFLSAHAPYCFSWFFVLSLVSSVPNPPLPAAGGRRGREWRRWSRSRWASSCFGTNESPQLAKPAARYVQGLNLESLCIAFVRLNRVGTLYVRRFVWSLGELAIVYPSLSTRVLQRTN